MVTLLRTLVTSSAAIHLQFVDPHGLHRTFTLGQGVVEADFVLSQPQVFASLVGFLHLLGEVDQFLDHFLRGDGSPLP